MTGPRQSKKAKAWMGVFFPGANRWWDVVQRADTVTLDIASTEAGSYRCQVIPDGAPMPIDRETKRLIKAALSWYDTCQHTELFASAAFDSACATYLKRHPGKGRK